MFQSAETAAVMKGCVRGLRIVVGGAVAMHSDDFFVLIVVLYFLTVAAES